jgi:hypothetical protein
MARCAIKRVVDAINARQVDRLLATSKVYTDSLGEVTPEEKEQFLELFGKKPELALQRDLETKRVSLLSTNGLYVVTLSRHYSEAAKRKDRHQMSHWSVWLVAFGSDEIASMRQATELWSFTLQNEAFGSDASCRTENRDG